MAPVGLQGLSEEELDVLLAQSDVGGNSIATTPGLPPLDVQNIVAATNRLLQQARQEVDSDGYTGPNSEVVEQVRNELDESSLAPSNSKPSLN